LECAHAGASFSDLENLQQLLETGRKHESRRFAKLCQKPLCTHGLQLSRPCNSKLAAISMVHSLADNMNCGCPCCSGFPFGTENQRATATLVKLGTMQQTHFIMLCFF
jgi:hypothetical protein